MKNEITFYKDKDLVIIDGDESIILRKGFLHINELSIDKTKSSKVFLRTFKEFSESGRLCLSTFDACCDDFLKLARFNFISMASGKRFLFIVDDNIFDNVKSLITDDAIPYSDFVAKKDLFQITIPDQVQKSTGLSDFDHVYYIGIFANLDKLRTINKVLFKLRIEYTIGFVDSNDVYLLGVQPQYTGCYSCLEEKIITHFSGEMKDYELSYNSEDELFENPSLALLISFIQIDQKNINLYGVSNLVGNVLYFYASNFEYSFEPNRKSSTCKVCAGLNAARFEEQNIRSISLVKGLLQ